MSLYTQKKKLIQLIDPIPISSLSTDPDKQTTTLELSSKLKAGTPARLMLFFVGSMNPDMAGFYRSSYKSQSGTQEYMFSTQFEACDARRAFPCFDEPNRKATFSVTISAPEGYDVLSNMPIKNKQELPGNPGHVEYTFEKTPKMSTYLLAWAIGKFEYIEAFTKREYGGKPLPVRVYTTHGLKEQARLALETAVKVVDYYSEAFDIDYPLPKLDMIAVHDFASNAMEHWGLVTYRVTALLFDEETSDPAYKTRVVYVIAHELAHQWFGNLVTMDWWSELWLNEGFATWMGWLAVDHLYPEWDVWAQFVVCMAGVCWQSRY
jgi:aminopeptidase N